MEKELSKLVEGRGRLSHSKYLQHVEIFWPINKQLDNYTNGHLA